MHYLEKELHEKVREDASIFMFLQDAALDGIWYWDLEQYEHEWFSDKFWETLGYDPSTKKPLSSEWQSIINQDDLLLVHENFENHLNDPKIPFDQVVRYRHKQGHTVWIRCRGMAVFNEEGKPVRMLGAHTNVSELKKVENHYRNLKEEYETVFKGTQDALFFIDVFGPKHFVYIRNNPAHQKQTGLTLAHIKGKTPYTLLGDTMGEIVTNNYQRCVDAKTSISYEEVLNLPAGERIWRTTLTPIIKAGVVKHIVGSGVDITQHKSLEKALERRANYDALTNLTNRAYAVREMMHRIRNEESFTIVFFDIDNFKDINDHYGHAMGDHVLKTVAKRTLSMLEDDDVASRFGGDEFLIIRTYLQDETSRKTFINQLKEVFSQPIDIETKTETVHISLGIANCPDEGTTYDALLQIADQAMYKMKRQHKTSKHSNT